MSSAKYEVHGSTAGIPLAARRGFTGQTLSIGEQRRLFRRWTTGSVHPHEALAGLLALLHAFTVAELRSVRVAAIDLDAQTLRVDGRPRAVPLDPTSLQAVSDCLTHRRSPGTRPSNTSPDATTVRPSTMPPTQKTIFSPAL